MTDFKADTILSNISVPQNPKTKKVNLMFVINKKQDKTVWLLSENKLTHLKDLEYSPDKDDDLLAKHNLNIMIKLSDADFNKLVLGKTSSQKLFMSGKLKIKGNDYASAMMVEKIIGQKAKL